MHIERYESALVLGAGRSGLAAQRLLRAEGAKVILLSEESAGRADLSVALAERSFDLCIVSPGFSFDHSWLDTVRAAGVPLLSELELGRSRHRGKTVAVTGSNGKSTAVKWICDMLNLAGMNATIGGNYGIPACEIVLDHPDLEWLVLEVSSFQLETVQEFSAEVAVLLNVFPNHLDRHKTMAAYRRTKERIFGPPAQQRGVCLVPYTLAPELDVERDWVRFGSSLDAEYNYQKGQVFHHSSPVLDLRGTQFESPVLGGCTGAAVAGVAVACEVPFSVVQKAAQQFMALPHRLQRLGERGGVSYVNDSKATNLVAVAAAIEACGTGVHLIAGGVPKELDFTFIKEILEERVRSIYLIGQVSLAMYEAWNKVCLCVECGTLEIAFNTARNAAQSGETILLSPGCASFDQFQNFAERGACFSALFKKLT